MSILDDKETIDNYFKEEPNDLIALCDADTIIFNACVENEYQFYNTESGEDEWHINLDEAFDHAAGKINLILEQTGCADIILALSTSSKHTFRCLQVSDQYKANRDNIRYPAGLKDLKLKMKDHYDVIMDPQVEADDIVVSMYDPKIHRLTAVDKDVLNAVPGKHWNYYQRAAYSRMTKAGMKSYDEIPAQYVEISEEHANYWPYFQCIIGDASDGIKGVPGVGPAGANKVVSENKTPAENWLGVVSAYESKGLSEIDAIINMRLVNMHQYNHETKEVTLWTPKEL